MLPMFTSEIRSIITLCNCIYKVHDNNLLVFSPGDIKILGWCPGGQSFTSLGEDAFLAWVGHACSGVCFPLTYQPITSRFL